MANKISPYRTGAPRFGNKSQPFDNSVKISYLTPEELEEYRSGKRGGSKLYTYDDYLRMKAEGQKVETIAAEMKISVPTLYNRIKAWKEQAGNTPQNEQKAPEMEKEVSETTNTTPDKTSEYKAVIAELKAQMESSSVAKDVIIEGLEKKVEHWKGIAEKNESLKVAELRAALNDTHEQMKETALKNVALGIKVNVLEEQLDEKTKKCQDLQTEYNELLEDYSNLKEEITPLRQLVLINMREKVGILT